METTMQAEGDRDIYANVSTTRKVSHYADEKDFRDDLDLPDDLESDGFAVAQLSPRDDRSMEIRRAVFRVLMGDDHRNATEIANSFGVSRAAVSKIGTEVAKRTGFDRFIRTPSAVANSAAAAERSWRSGHRKKKTAVAGDTTAVTRKN
jgi:hypothetical protein